MIFSENNRKLIVKELKALDGGLKSLPMIPEPGVFPPPGFLTIEFQDHVADGFDKCFIFRDGMVLNSRTGFNHDMAHQLDLISANTTLIHHYAPDGTVVSHSKYVWMDLETYFLGVIVSR